MSSGISLQPPHRIFSDFLSSGLAQELLDYATRPQQAVDASKTRDGYDPSIRKSQKLYLSQALKQSLEEKILPLAQAFISSLRVSAFEPAGLELELVAHGDGAFYKRHIDTFTGIDSHTPKQRMISAVLYLHRTPRAFSGGELRLYALGRTSTITDYVDIDPMHNSLVIFPSWAPHSVERVSCASGQLIDSRFAINAWLWRKNPDLAPSNGQG